MQIHVVYYCSTFFLEEEPSKTGEQNEKIVNDGEKSGTEGEEKEGEGEKKTMEFEQIKEVEQHPPSPMMMVLCFLS